MTILQFVFWFLFLIVFYTYIGYGILLFLIIKIRRIAGLSAKKNTDTAYEPDVTLFIAAYN